MRGESAALPALAALAQSAPREVFFARRMSPRKMIELCSPPCAAANSAKLHGFKKSALKLNRSPRQNPPGAVFFRENGFPRRRLRRLLGMTELGLLRGNEQRANLKTLSFRASAHTGVGIRLLFGRFVKRPYVLAGNAAKDATNGRGKPRPYGHAGSLFEERRGGACPSRFLSLPRHFRLHRRSASRSARKGNGFSRRFAPRNDKPFELPVILSERSESKNLIVRSFASLRMTGLYACCLFVTAQKTQTLSFRVNTHTGVGIRISFSDPSSAPAIR